MYSFSKFKEEIKDVEKWLTNEFSSIRTGRATPAILDGVKVESYGAFMPVNQLANTTVEDARTLRVVPWDKSQSKPIEKAINQADLGVSVSVDDKGLRVFFPELTVDRRASLIKMAKNKLEDARVALRGEREKVWNDVQAKERDGEVTEDEKFRAKEEIQKIIDDANSSLEEIFNRKEKEVSG